MPLIENKILQYVLVIGLLWACIWFGDFVGISLGYKLLFMIGSALGAFLYLEGYLTKLRRRG